MESSKMVKLAVLFLVSYFILYLLGLNTPMHDIDFSPGLGMLDYMYVLIPLPGFFLMYFMIDWINDFYGSRAGSKPWLPLGLLALSIPAYFVALYFFYGNIALLQGGEAQPTDYFDFWQQFWDSAYLYFILAALFGWVSYQILEKTAKTKK